MADEEERNVEIYGDDTMMGQKGDKRGVFEQEEEERIIELVVSVQQAGNERGKRVYFDSKSMEDIKERCGDDFFLFTERTLLAFVDTSNGKITLTPLKGVYKNYL